MAAITVISSSGVQAQGLATDWIEGHKNRVRLTAGSVEGSAPDRIYAFLEIGMDKGWKTYWRNPGSAGGIPPEFDWSKSSNIAAAEVLYPVPQIMSDKAGDVIGYRDHVIFPVRITPERPGEPVSLALTVNYGICEKLCVPVEVSLELDVPAGDLPAAAPDEVRALDAVPRSGNQLRPGDPSGFKAEMALQGPEPRATIQARFPGSADAAQVFLFIADGRFIPLPVRREANGEVVSFDIDLSNPEDLERVKGASVLVTLKGEKGQSEATFVID